MPTYATGATVERLYPGPNAEAARAAAQPQIDAFLAAGFMIAGERWLDDSTSGGTPVGDAVATGTISYQASRPTDLPPALPAYTLEDPRAVRLQTWSQMQLVVGAVFVVIVLFVFVVILSQMMSTNQRMGPFGP